MRFRVALAALVVALTVSCSAFSRVVNELDRESPPPELGRPDWVRYPAAGGAWLGGAVGVVGSIVTLPLTFPITLVADEPFGHAKETFLLWGVALAAGTGHFVVGAPFDTVDYVFRRAWVERPVTRESVEEAPEPEPVAPDPLERSHG